MKENQTLATEIINDLNSRINGLVGELDVARRKLEIVRMVTESERSAGGGEEMTGADYREAIIKKVSEIKDIWLLEQIYRLICNVTKK